MSIYLNAHQWCCDQQILKVHIIQQSSPPAFRAISSKTGTRVLQLALDYQDIDESKPTNTKISTSRPASSKDMSVNLPLTSHPVSSVSETFSPPPNSSNFVELETDPSFNSSSYTSSSSSATSPKSKTLQKLFQPTQDNTLLRPSFHRTSLSRTQAALQHKLQQSLGQHHHQRINKEIQQQIEKENAQKDQSRANMIKMSKWAPSDRERDQDVIDTDTNQRSDSSFSSLSVSSRSLPVCSKLGDLIARVGRFRKTWTNTSSVLQTFIGDWERSEHSVTPRLINILKSRI